MSPQRITLSRAKGWRMPENTVRVARPGYYGNPYTVDVFGLPLAVDLYRNTLEGCWSPSLVEGLSDATAAHAYRLHCELHGRMQLRPAWLLRGKNLACWCKQGEPCHADVLLELANA